MCFGSGSGFSGPVLGVGFCFGLRGSPLAGVSGAFSVSGLEGVGALMLERP